jgi:membrane-associated phospholipid phosphatase
VLLAVFYDAGWLVELDVEVAARAAAAPGWPADAARVLGALGGHVVLPLAAVAGVALCLRAGRPGHAVFLVAVALGTDLLVHGGRALHEPTRAAVAGLPDASRFPAGHAATAVALWTALAVVAASGRSRGTRLALVGGGFVLGLAVAWSRVVLGVHAASDVLAGLLLGGFWLLLCMLALVQLEGRRVHPSALAGAASVAVFALLALTYGGASVGGLDEDVARRVAASLPGWVEWAARPFSWVGGWIGLTAAGVLAGVLLVRERAWVDLAFLVAAFAGSQALANGLKPAFDRPRPDLGSPVPVPGSGAFPSGHAAAATACVGALAVLLAERLGRRSQRVAVWTVAVALGVGIGLSRIALGVHWLSDVLAGWAIGIAWLALCLLARELLRSRRRPSGVSS